MNTSDTKYSFSYTAAAMKFHDFMRLVRYVDEHQIDVSKDELDPDLIMGRDNTRTNQREFRELFKRYLQLTPRQREVIGQLDVTGQKQLAFVAICKTYAFISDFTIEVLRDKLMSFDFILTDGDFQSFFNRKILLHPELEDFSDSTIKKAKQVTLRMFEEAGWIGDVKTRNIQPQFAEAKLLKAVAADNPELLKIFLLSDNEIDTATYNG